MHDLSLFRFWSASSLLITSILSKDILSATPLSKSRKCFLIALFNTGPLSESSFYASFDFPLGLRLPLLSNLTEGDSGSSPLDFDRLDGVLLPTPSLYLRKFSATSLLTILFRTVLEIFDKG
jgi:hypothetical protein